MDGSRRWSTAGVALGSALLASGPLRDRDWGFHLATFERIVAERRLPVDDAFSYASDWPYEPVHLLFQLLLGPLHRGLGADGISLLRAALAVAIGLALHRALRGRGLDAWSAAALALLVQAGGAFRLVERPHLATTLGLVLLLDALLAWRERGLDRPWRLVPILWLWANAHAPGVVYGVVTAWAFALAEAARARLGWRGAQPAARLGGLGGCLAAATLATCVNPLGPELYPYLLRQGAVRDAAVVELRPVWAVASDAPRLGAGLLVLGALLALSRARRLDPVLAAASAAFVALGLLVSREVALALIVVALLLAPVVARGVAAARPAARRAAFALALVPPLLFVVERQVRPGLALGRWPGGLDPTCYPISEADWIDAHAPRGRLWNTNAVGSYLVHRLWPRYQVFSDGRMQMFGEALRLERGDFAALEARWAPEILVVDFSHGELYVPSPERSPGFDARFALVHVGGAAKVYLRRGAGNDALIERLAYRHLRLRGRAWPGRPYRVGADTVVPVPAPADPDAFAAEVARARREDPRAARWLP